MQSTAGKKFKKKCRTQKHPGEANSRLLQSLARYIISPYVREASLSPLHFRTATSSFSTDSFIFPPRSLISFCSCVRPLRPPFHPHPLLFFFNSRADRSHVNFQRAPRPQTPMIFARGAPRKIGRSFSTLPAEIGFDVLPSASLRGWRARIFILLAFVRVCIFSLSRYFFSFLPFPGACSARCFPRSS